MEKIRVAICDDTIIFCRNISMRIESDEELIFVAEAHGEYECMDMVEKVPIDVLLLDIQMETATSGTDLIPKIKSLQPKIKIIMLTSYENSEYVFSAFLNGANDYLVKGRMGHDVIPAIKNVYKNTTTLRPEIAKNLTHKMQEVQNQNKSLMYLIGSVAKLTQAEFDVLKALCQGKRYKEIAKDRVVEECTIRTIGMRIKNKFGEAKMESLIRNLKETGLDRMLM